MIRAARLDRLEVDGQPKPWLTVAATDLIEQRMTPDLRVFEWGSGSSTIWWTRLSRSVVSVEHDPVWHRLVSQRAPDATVLHRPLNAGYENAIREHGPVDVVLADGPRRAECVDPAIESLAEGGVIVWDNAERPEYEQALERLAGLTRIDFPGTGYASWSNQPWVTALFFPADNCLELR